MTMSLAGKSSPASLLERSTLDLKQNTLRCGTCVQDACLPTCLPEALMEPPPRCQRGINFSTGARNAAAPSEQPLTYDSCPK